MIDRDPAVRRRIRKQRRLERERLYQEWNREVELQSRRLAESKDKPADGPESKNEGSATPSDPNEESWV